MCNNRRNKSASKLPTRYCSHLLLNAQSLLRVCCCGARPPPLSIDSSCPPGPRPQNSGLQRSIYGTDRRADGRTDAVPLYRPSAYYARGVNKRLLTAKNGRRRSSSRFQSLTCVPICTPGKPAKCHRYIATYRTTEISRYPVLACTPREGPVNTVKSFNA